MTNEPENEKEALLRVSAGSSSKSLASAIAHAVYDGQPVVLRAVGAGAVSQAVKAIAIAQSFVGPKAIVLSCRPGFATVEMPDGNERSAVILRVFPS